MIEQMKKYEFLIQASRYDDFLARLQEAGVVHVTIKQEGISEDPQLQDCLTRVAEIRHLLEQGASDQLIREMDDIRSQINSAIAEKNRVEPWGEFSSAQLAEFAKAGLQLHFYVCSKKQFSDKLGVFVNEVNGNVYFFALQNNEEMPDYCQEITLNKSVNELDADIAALNGLLTVAQARIEAWQWANLENLKDELVKIEGKINWQRVSLSGDTAAEGALRLLEGFCPANQCDALEEILNTTNCYYESSDPQEGDATPIKLRNNRFTQLFEVFTGMYGMPSYKEFDPTPILAPFYLLFFAMCMGDAGYGIVMIIAGLLIHKGKLKISMFDGLGPIITTLGAGTFVIGLLLGTFFGMPLLEASWYPESLKKFIIHGTFMNFDIQMVLALVIGVFHICLAMVVKTICYTQRYGFRQSLSTWGWTLLIVGGIIIAALSMAFSLPAESIKWIVIVLAVVSGLGIYVFNTPGRNPLLNIGSGLWDTYNMATGLLGDVLSYVRLYALGLAGGMLGSAFNDIALMVLGEHPTWQWLPFLLILLFGHILNLLMSALGAFVHPLRLTFVEYFKNSGYEGKGTSYSPFKA